MKMKSAKVVIPMLMALQMAGLAFADGAAAYGAKCASCHAKDGKGNPAMAKVFKVEPPVLDMTKKATLDQSDADLEKIITDGLNKMPAYKDKLSADDIKATVAYLRSLAAKP